MYTSAYKQSWWLKMLYVWQKCQSFPYDKTYTSSQRVPISQSLVNSLEPQYLMSLGNEEMTSYDGLIVKANPSTLHWGTSHAIWRGIIHAVWPWITKEHTPTPKLWHWSSNVKKKIKTKINTSESYLIICALYDWVGWGGG